MESACHTYGRSHLMEIVGFALTLLANFDSLTKRKGMSRSLVLVKHRFVIGRRIHEHRIPIEWHFQPHLYLHCSSKDTLVGPRMQRSRCEEKEGEISLLKRPIIVKRFSVFSSVKHFLLSILRNREFLLWTLFGFLSLWMLVG